MNLRIPLAAGLIAMSSVGLAFAEEGAICHQEDLKPGSTDEICQEKLEFCVNTPPIFISSIRSKENGTTERQAIKNIMWGGLNCGFSNCGWYARNERFVIDVVHSIYSDNEVYRGLKDVMDSGDPVVVLTDVCMSDPRIVIYP